MLVAYSRLDISDHDRDWIDGVRGAHDPQHAVIEAHVTFVFPLNTPVTREIVAHIRTVADRSEIIQFSLLRAVAIRDPAGSRSHVMLVPGAGEGRMKALHAWLYAGPLAAHLRRDIPYRPHVTVGVSASHEHAALLAASIGEIEIRGTLRAIHLAEYDGSQVCELCRFAFNRHGQVGP